MELQKIIKAYQELDVINPDSTWEVENWLLGFFTQEQLDELSADEMLFIAGAYWADDQK